jgi:hypothetical protein
MVTADPHRRMLTIKPAASIKLARYDTDRRIAVDCGYEKLTDIKP